MKPIKLVLIIVLSLGFIVGTIVVIRKSTYIEYLEGISLIENDYDEITTPMSIEDLKAQEVKAIIQHDGNSRTIYIFDFQLMMAFHDELYTFFKETFKDVKYTKGVTLKIEAEGDHYVITGKAVPKNGLFFTERTGTYSEPIRLLFSHLGSYSLEGNSYRYINYMSSYLYSKIINQGFNNDDLYQFPLVMTMNYSGVMGDQVSVINFYFEDPFNINIVSDTPFAGTQGLSGNLYIYR